MDSFAHVYRATTKPSTIAAFAASAVLAACSIASSETGSSGQDDTANAPAAQQEGGPTSATDSAADGAVACRDATTWYQGSFAALDDLPEALAPNLDAYTPPTDARLLAFDELLAAVLDAVDTMRNGAEPNWCGIKDTLAPPAGYGVFRFFHPETKRYYLALVDTLTSGEQARILINPEARRNVVIESPHTGPKLLSPGVGDTSHGTDFDKGALEGATSLFFSDLAPRAVMFNGGLRCKQSVPTECAGTTPQCQNVPGGAFPISDMAHTTKSIFHHAHMIFNDRSIPRDRVNGLPTRFAQVHHASAEAVISTGANAPNDPGAVSNKLKTLIQARVHNPASVHSCNDGDDGTGHDSIIGVVTNNECADVNPQALYSNVTSLSCGAQNPPTESNRFMQIEGMIDWWSTDTSTDGSAASVGWFQVMDALRDPTLWGACDWTCSAGETGASCGLGPAQSPQSPATKCTP